MCACVHARVVKGAEYSASGIDASSHLRVRADFMCLSGHMRECVVRIIQRLLVTYTYNQYSQLILVMSTRNGHEPLAQAGRSSACATRRPPDDLHLRLTELWFTTKWHTVTAGVMELPR